MNHESVSPSLASQSGDLGRSVIISCCGAFHARHAALAAYKCGMLDRYITTQSRYAQVPDEFVTRVPLIEHMHRAGDRFLKVPWWDWNLVKKGIFDRIACSHVQPYHKIFHAFSAFQERSLRRADELGAKKIVDWSQAHPEYGRKLLREEYSLLGIDEAPSLGKIDSERCIAELRQADLILVPSDFVANSFREQGEDSLPIHQNPYGVDLEMFPQTQRTDNTFRVIFVGSICVRKGIQYLLEAAKRLEKLGVDLLLVGTVAPDARSLMAHYSGLYRHIPAIPQHELVRYYGNSSVFAFPSLLEGMAYVVLEAMACALPCIVTPNAGSITRDGKDGFVIPIRNVDALIDKILFFHQNEQARTEMGRSARIRAEQFTWGQYGNRLIKYYQGLLTDDR